MVKKIKRVLRRSETRILVRAVQLPNFIEIQGAFLFLYRRIFHMIKLNSLYPCAVRPSAEKTPRGQAAAKRNEAECPRDRHCERKGRAEAAKAVWTKVSHCRGNTPP